MKKIIILIFMAVSVQVVKAQTDTLIIVKKDAFSITSDELKQNSTFKLDDSTPEIVLKNEIDLIELQMVNLIINNYWDYSNAVYLAMDFQAWLKQFKTQEGIKSDVLTKEITSWFRNKTNDMHFIFQDVGEGYAGAVRISNKASVDSLKNETTSWFQVKDINNYGIKKCGITWNNIAYIEYDFFHPMVKEATDALDSVLLLQSFKDTDALIFDLRNNGGGDGDMAAYLIGYFIEQDSMPIWRFENRYNGDELSVIQYAKHNTKINLKNKRVYVLTSNKTGSAAENFIQICKSQNFATIIGESTAGATHPMATFKVSNRFTFGLPHGRIIDINSEEDTQKQGGIIPDIHVHADKALDEVLNIEKNKLKLL